MIPLRVVLHYLLLFSFFGGCTFPVYILPAASSSHVPAPGVKPAAASLQISSGAGVSTTDSQEAANLTSVLS